MGQPENTRQSPHSSLPSKPVDLVDSTVHVFSSWPGWSAWLVRPEESALRNLPKPEARRGVGRAARCSAQRAGKQMEAGIVEQTVRRKLSSHFQPHHLDVINESSGHNVPKWSETHFKVVVVSDVFAGFAEGHVGTSM